MQSIKDKSDKNLKIANKNVVNLILHKSIYTVEYAAARLQYS